jgi:hypothetical protein
MDEPIDMDEYEEVALSLLSDITLATACLATAYMAEN